MAATAAIMSEAKPKVSTDATLPTFIVIGAAGDGKSSLVKSLLPPGVDPPEVGKRGDGVTKCITEYSILDPKGEQWSLIDTMGVGDHDSGVTQLIAGLKAVLQSGRQVDGLWVTTLLASNRLGTAAQILHQVIKHGLVKDDEVSPWERVIVCGTQRDRCDEEEIAGFADIAGLFFKDCGVVYKDNQIVTCSAKQPDGMAELLEKTSVLGRQPMVWDPCFDTNGGSRRMAAGVCEVTGGDVNLTQLQLEMHMAWTALMQQETQADLTSSAGAAVGEAGVLGVAHAANDFIAAGVGKQVIAEYAANQAAARVGSGVMTGGIALQKGSEVAVGKSMMSAMKEGGLATLKARAGNVVVDVGTQSALVSGISAGASLGAGAAGIGAELIAGRYEATKEYKKQLGFGAQVATAAAVGSCAGPLGAALGAGAGAFSWGAGQALGHVVEKIIIDSKGEDNPKVIQYKAAKDKYEKALAHAAK